MVEQYGSTEFYAEDGVEDWRVVLGGGWACAFFPTGSFEAALSLVRLVGEQALAAGHHPDVDLRPEGVFVRLFSADPGGLSPRDAALARAISGAAHAAGYVADPSYVQHVQVAIDAMAIPSVLPFWAAVLGYREEGEEDVLDRLRRGPSFWFQQMDAPRSQRNRIHIDVYVATDQAEKRVAAALAAGGRIVDGSRAPKWWTLADPEGNEVDVACWG
ncbi:hypothetical protein Val02_91140 [Virgisporangium aliadipatigenens]|uniref:Putative pterin-4-alpha-carbinolamine dehydratase n=1 Tax=Virgisporangium aliadipatigenens TaxID=741659 RepID=A0A8J4DWG4_9ACTN|nr:VOC family protein [Virgisporangium aliadipatigenens]GIJ52228.1 hypothetical protein Val02_91140 [Virgisporangium aliadipatigenens]